MEITAVLQGWNNSSSCSNDDDDGGECSHTAPYWPPSQRRLCVDTTVLRTGTLIGLKAMCVRQL